MSEQDVAGRAGMTERVLVKVDGALNSLEKGLVWLSAITTGFVMCVVSADALGRYLFNSPVVFTIDLVSHFLLPIIMLLASGMVLRRGKHISVDIFANILPVRMYQFFLGAGFIAAAVIFWIMTHRVGETAVANFVQGKRSFGIIPWPLWIEQAIYFVCLGVMMLRFFHVGAVNLSASITGNSELADTLLREHAAHLEETF